jgi:hypothetical protein
VIRCKRCAHLLYLRHLRHLRHACVGKKCNHCCRLLISNDT